MLHFKARSSDPRGKSRVYFCAEEADMQACFASVSEAFLSAWDCAIYYSDNTDKPDADWEMDISMMNCICVFLSYRFLRRENHWLHTICSTAKKLHIPMIAILTEPVAGEEFSRLFDSLCTLELQELLSAGPEQMALKKILSALFVELTPEGSWIFLSHSSDDIQKIRLIRNRFEKNGQNPLAFHLKCLRTDTEEGCKELEGLIKREIDARDWFVFCQSEAANQSDYVTMEREYVRKAGKKRIWTLDLSLPMDEVLRIVDRICQQVQVFISYRKRDRSLAHILQQDLYENDFNVWMDDFLTPGENMADSIRDQIRNCDLFVALVCDGYLDSFCGNHELPAAIHDHKNILLVFVGNPPIPPQLSIYLAHYQCIHLPPFPQPADLHAITECIEAMALSSIRNTY